MWAKQANKNTHSWMHAKHAFKCVCTSILWFSKQFFVDTWAQEAVVKLKWKMQVWHFRCNALMQSLEHSARFRWKIALVVLTSGILTLQSFGLKLSSVFFFLITNTDIHKPSIKIRNCFSHNYWNSTFSFRRISGRNWSQNFGNSPIKQFFLSCIFWKP